MTIVTFQALKEWSKQETIILLYQIIEDGIEQGTKYREFAND